MSGLAEKLYVYVVVEHQELDGKITSFEAWLPFLGSDYRHKGETVSEAISAVVKPFAAQLRTRHAVALERDYTICMASCPVPPPAGTLYVVTFNPNEDSPVVSYEAYKFRAKFEVGEKVRLKAGGPVMTVTEWPEVLRNLVGTLAVRWRKIMSEQTYCCWWDTEKRKMDASGFIHDRLERCSIDEIDADKVAAFVRVQKVTPDDILVYTSPNRVPTDEEMKFASKLADVSGCKQVIVLSAEGPPPDEKVVEAIRQAANCQPMPRPVESWGPSPLQHLYPLFNACKEVWKTAGRDPLVLGVRQEARLAGKNEIEAVLMLAKVLVEEKQRVEKMIVEAVERGEWTAQNESLMRRSAWSSKSVVGAQDDLRIAKFSTEVAGSCGMSKVVGFLGAASVDDTPRAIVQQIANDVAREMGVPAPLVKMDALVKMDEALPPGGVARLCGDEILGSVSWPAEPDPITREDATECQCPLLQECVCGLRGKTP